MNLNAHELAALIEYQLLKPDASVADVDRVCTEARTHGFASVCVNGSRVIRAAAFEHHSDSYNGRGFIPQFDQRYFAVMRRRG